METEKGKGGIYIYCLINNGIETSFGNIGIKDNEVYTTPFKDIAAVVHRHSPQTSNLKPQTSEEDMVELAISHQHIIDMATEKFGTVIPFNPNTIIEGKEEKVVEWLKRDYIKIKNTLKGIEDKAEFEIQVFMARDVLINRIKEESEEFKRLKELTMNPGKAYVLGQRILREEVEKKVNFVCKSFYAQISKCADKIRINKTEGVLMQEKQPIMNLSCLVQNDKIEELKTVLKKIGDLEGFDARLSGPWQPYNFARL
ncbi:MAG: GvpL/GvpF family gas vesicle protein [Halobacteriota archaeon]